MPDASTPNPVSRRVILGVGALGAATVATGCATLAASNLGSFLSGLRQVDAGVLNVGYVEAGDASGQPVILLHGWPYDIHTYGEVSGILADAGYRVIVPYLRGY